MTDSKDRHMRVALLDDFHVVQNVVNIFIDGIDVNSSSVALSVSHCETKRRDQRYFPVDFILLNNFGRCNQRQNFGTRRDLLVNR